METVCAQTVFVSVADGKSAEIKNELYLCAKS